MPRPPVLIPFIMSREEEVEEGVKEEVQEEGGVKGEGGVGGKEE